MKRRISLVIAFALSFLMMFSSIAMAGEIKVQIPGSTSESDKLEIIIKVPPVETNKADSPPLQEKVSVQVLEVGEPDPIRSKPDCSIMCSNGAPGFLSRTTCVPC
jgi:hypothetical protein